jgi:hypothetical protein
MKWNRLDTVYFLVITLLTIGYGDYHPVSERERVFTAFFIIFGIAVCSSALGSMSTLLQSHQERINKQRNMRAMLLMKEEEKAEEERSKSFAASDSIGNISLTALRSTARQDVQLTDEESATGGGTVTSPMAGMDEEGADTLSDDRKKSTSVAKRRQSLLDMAMSLSIDRPRKKTLKELRDASLSAFEEDYHQMMLASIFDVVAMFVILIVGMIGMHIIEGWSYGEAFYWATVTIMTVGYGDITPNSTRGKTFTIFYCLIGCAFMAKVLTDFIRYPLLARMVRNEEEVARQFTGVSNSPELLENIFDNDLHKLVPDLKRNADEMTKCEFVLVLLHLMNKLEEKDVFLAAKLFDDMDVDFKGYFSRQDMSEKVVEAVERSKQHDSRVNIDDANNARGTFTNSILGNITRKFTDAGLDGGGRFIGASPKTSTRKIPFERSRSEKSNGGGGGGYKKGEYLSQSWNTGELMGATNTAAASSSSSTIRSSLLDPASSQPPHPMSSSSYGGYSSTTSGYVPPSSTLRPFQQQSSSPSSSSSSSSSPVPTPVASRSALHTARPTTTTAAAGAPVVARTSSSSALSRLFQPQQPPRPQRQLQQRAEGKRGEEDEDDIYSY